MAITKAPLRHSGPQKPFAKITCRGKEKCSVVKTSYKVIEYRLYEGLVQIQGMLNLLKFDEALSNAVVEVKELIKSKKYKIAVMGEFKRGKSSLINALLGARILPADATPTTATINRIVYGETPECVVTYKDGQAQSIKINELSDYIAKITPNGQAMAMKVKEATVYFPTVICQNHIEIIDTPGLNDDERMTRITIDMVNQVDAVILPVHARFPFSETEMKFVCQLIEADTIDTVVFVVTFLDQLDEDDYEYDQFMQKISGRIQSSVLEELVRRNAGDETIKKAHAMLDELNIYGISSKLALDSFVSNNRDKLRQSRFETFSNELTGIVTARQTQHACSKTLGCMRRVVAQMQPQYDQRVAQINGKMEVLLSHGEAVQQYSVSSVRMLNDIFAESYPKCKTIIAEYNSYKNEMVKTFIASLSTVRINESAVIRQALKAAAQKDGDAMNQTLRPGIHQKLLQVMQADAQAVGARRGQALCGHLAMLQIEDLFELQSLPRFAQTVLDNVSFTWAADPGLGMRDLTKINVIDSVVNLIDLSFRQYEELYEGAFSAIRKNWFDTIRANAAALEQAAKGKIVQKRLEQSTELETLKSNYAVLKKEAEAQLQSLEAQWCEYENAL